MKAMEWFRISTIWKCVWIICFLTAPLKPNRIKMSPIKEKYKEGDHVTFTCTADVGQPTGVFWWFINCSSGDTNWVTNWAEHRKTVLSRGPDNGSFVGTSTYTLIMKRSCTNLLIRCKVFNQTQKPNMSGYSDICRQLRMTDILHVISEKHNADFDDTMQIVLMATLFVLIIITGAAVTCFFLWRKRKLDVPVKAGEDYGQEQPQPLVKQNDTSIRCSRMSHRRASRGQIEEYYYDEESQQLRRSGSSLHHVSRERLPSNDKEHRRRSRRSHRHVSRGKREPNEDSSHQVQEINKIVN